MRDDSGVPSSFSSSLSHRRRLLIRHGANVQEKTCGKQSVLSYLLENDMMDIGLSDTKKHVKTAGQGGTQLFVVIIGGLCTCDYG